VSEAPPRYLNVADRLLIPPPVPRDRAAEAWLELIDTGEALLKAGFATRFGPDKVEVHYRAWCDEQIAEHDRKIVHLLSELSRRESGDAGNAIEL
jgi:hypothetical protein